MTNTTFHQAKDEHFERLAQFTPIVERVHGESHPEFYEVRKLFDTIHEKTEKAGAGKPELDEEFSQLRTVTDNYKVPEDTCESYEAVYQMLEAVDKAYQN